MLAFNLWNRRGLWRAVAETTRACVELSIGRAEAKVRLARAVGGFLVVEVLSAGALLAVAAATERAPPARLLAVGAAVMALAAVSAVWARWYGRAAERELADLHRLRHQVGEGEDEGGGPERGLHKPGRLSS